MRAVPARGRSNATVANGLRFSLGGSNHVQPHGTRAKQDRLAGDRVAANQLGRTDSLFIWAILVLGESDAIDGKD